MQDTSDGGMSDNEILGLCFMFVLAGLDTVTSAVGFSLAKLASDVQLRDRVANDSSLIPAYVEDILRVDGRSHSRHVSPRRRSRSPDGRAEGHNGDAQLRQRRRDPRRYEDADEVHLDNKAVHFAFGRGPHRCLVRTSRASKFG